MTDDGAVARVRTFWRRALRGPSVGARIAIYEELAPMLSAGIGLREALRHSADRHSGAKKRAIETLEAGVARDATLSDTMRADPLQFSALEAAILATGERTGRLDAAFVAAAAQLERRKKTRDRLVQACLYPLFVFHCFILMVGAVRMFGGRSFLAVVVPSYAAFWGAVLAIVSVHAALADSKAYAQFVERLPVLGRFVRSAALARFARAFAALHGAGTPYDESLRVAAEASGSALLRADAATAAFVLAKGAPLPVALEQLRSFPVDDLGLLVSGERSGALEEAAARVAALEEERSDVVAKRVTSLLPGFLVLLVGIAVAAYAISFYAGYYADINKMLK